MPTTPTTTQRTAAPAPIAFRFDDLQAQAQRIIRDAEEQARKIVAQSVQTARDEAAAQRAAGYQAGLDEGRAAGLEQIRTEIAETLTRDARARIDVLVEALRTALEAFEQEKRRMLAAAEAGVVTLALAIAERVCKRELPAPESALANARALIELTRHTADGELCFNPEDLELMRHVAGPELERLAALAHVRIDADATVSPGGAMLRTVAGEADARIETQLERIAAAIGHAAAQAEPRL